MKIKVLYFASYREQCGKDTETFSLPNKSTLADLVARVLEANIEIKCSPERMVAAVNEEYQTHDQVLLTGDIVALIPPVSGG
ncbi:MAG TPA: molybdopterin converting factor subunit 1 [Dehalococcoidia bacterium]|nr:molybdopterin converting factor subunit 1 [Dehalococcoidia bacterium]MBV45706.1 molybdopterin converting factor subunit 1 [Dehalococcoidia bacterium]HAT21485.1 molybdopterin converting factor subunit 1 [Dehalococcoidia bacterium]HBF01098.1 molybdopterin converting factor subunit 1 [Dehalococcoidia bacterium]HBR65075.1 molybdopterin converting factor subunit 1 [Dehalococcoidia bacterium]